MAHALRREKFRDYLLFGVVVSLIGHILFVLPLLHTTGVAPKAQVFNIEFFPLPARKDPALKQIVTEPESPEAITPEARYLAEKARATKQEQIKRGDAPDAGKIVDPGKDIPEPAETKVPKRKKQALKETPITKKQGLEEKQPTLRLDQRTLLKEFSTSKKKAPTSSTTTPQMPHYQAFSRPSGSGARFFGAPGQADFLPNLPDGDITLLNTKAGHFAVFVRRVATQVFSQIRVVGWDTLRIGDIQGMEQFSRVRAVLSPQGELLRVELEATSGKRRFDDVLLKAVELGAKDPNPPQGALADDGNIHFIFLARSWAQVVTSGRSGVPTERRWLLLSTGLE